MKKPTKKLEELSPKERKRKNLSAIEQHPTLVEAFTLREVFEFMVQVAPSNVCLNAIAQKGWDTKALMESI